MTIKDRILFFLKTQHIKKNDFFVETGIAASNFKGKGLDSELGGDKIVKILSSYPNLSSEWLLTGKGDMLKEGTYGVSMGNNNHQVNIGSSNILNESNIPFIKKDKKVVDEQELLKRKISDLKTENDHLKDKIALLEKNISDKEYIISILKK